MTEQPMLNRFLEALAGLCDEHRVEEKWLLAPSLRIGRQWTDALAREGQATLNLRVHTLRSLVLGLAAPAIAAQGLGLIQGLPLRLLVGRLFGERLQGQGGYLGALRPGPGLYRVLANGLSDLRLAGLRAADLGGASFEVRAKGEELRQLLDGYERALHERGLVDYAGALRLAVARLRDDAQALAPAALLIRAEEPDPTGLERALWQAIPEARRRCLPADPPERRPAALSMFRAAGEVNEVREVLRRCAEAAIPADCVELVHCDAEAYVPLVHELAAGLAPGSEDALPVTFGEGLPVSGLRPGRALIAWVSWVRSGFPQATLQRMIADGLLLPEPERGGPGFSRLARLLRTVPVVRSRERYLPAIDAAIAAAGHRLAEGEADADSARATEPRRAGLALRIEHLRLLRSLVERLLEHAPLPEQHVTQVLERARGFLERCVRGKGQLEQYGLNELVKRVAELQDALQIEDAMPGLDVWEWLLALPGELRVGGTGPRPGCLHVTGLASGGHSGRPQVFVIGLDDGRFPGAGLQDPLLLDAERRRLSGALPTAAGRLSDRERSLALLLARQRGEVVLGYSCHDLCDDRARFPSPALLPIFRELSGAPDGDHRALAAWLGAPAGFAPAREAACLDARDWWLWRAARADPEPLDPDATARCLRFRQAGLHARRERESDRFTLFDGHVPGAGEHYDPAVPVSASRLEMLGRCPLEYFLCTVLGVERPEEYTADPGVWLDALARGSLLHNLFREFMTRLLAAGHDVPVLERDRPLLEAVLAELVAAAREALPPPDERTFERERADLEQTALIFLQEEERAGAHRRPFCFEASVGLPSEGQGTVLDSPDPEPIALPDGARLMVRGRIDRIDADPAHPGQRFFVWDYKTGSSHGYDPRDPIQGGRRVQGPLYLALAEARLRAVVSPAARVEGFGYFFPGTRAHGERIAWPAAELARGREALARLASMLATGCFPLSDDLDDLHFSEVGDALGADAPRAEQMRRKLRNPANTALQPFRRLRGYGEDEDHG